MMVSNTFCPLCGIPPSRELRHRTAGELAASYSAYCGIELTPGIAERYFRYDQQEHLCVECELRWYTPSTLGESDFYEHLGSYPSYYRSESWDKVTTLRLLRELGADPVVEIGCGDCWLLRRVAASGVKVFGTELNRLAIARAQADGFEVFPSNSPAIAGRTAKALVSLQTLEHVHEPLQWLKAEVERFRPEYLLIAVPACDTMLGYTSDPLAWPPHHFTQWSERSLNVLATKLGFSVERILFEPNYWQRFDELLNVEKGRQLWGLPSFPRGVFGRLCFKLARMLKRKWALRAHTVLAVLRLQ